MDARDLEQLIAQALPKAKVAVTSPDGVHFSATIEAAEFTGLSLLQRHRRVHAALGARLGGEIHALSITAQAPGEH